MTTHDAEQFNLWQDPTEPESLARLERFLASVQRSTRSIDDLTTPLSKAIAANCRTALDRLATMPEDGSLDLRAIRAELVDLTRSAVRKLARRLHLDRDRLLTGDHDEWQVAYDGEPGGAFGNLNHRMASLADSIEVPPRPATPDHLPPTFNHATRGLTVTVGDVATATFKAPSSLTGRIREWGKPIVHKSGRRAARYYLDQIQPVIISQFKDESNRILDQLKAVAKPL